MFRKLIMFAKIVFNKTFGAKNKVKKEVKVGIEKIDNILEVVPPNVVHDLIDIVSGNNVPEQDRETYKQVLDTTFSIATLVYKLNQRK